MIAFINSICNLPFPSLTLIYVLMVASVDAIMNNRPKCECRMTNTACKAQFCACVFQLVGVLSLVPTSVSYTQIVRALTLFP